MSNRADIGVFGGSGFYEFLEGVEEVWIETPYGPPSDRIALAEMNGKRVAFSAQARQRPSLSAPQNQLSGQPMGDERTGGQADNRSIGRRKPSASH